MDSVYLQLDPSDKILPATRSVTHRVPIEKILTGILKLAGIRKKLKKKNLYILK